MDSFGQGRHGARRYASNVGVVSPRGNKENNLPVLEDWGHHCNVWKMAPSCSWVVWDKNISFLNIFAGLQLVANGYWRNWRPRAGVFRVSQIQRRERKLPSCIAPRWTGMWGALATKPPSGPNKAQEKSSRSLMLVDIEIRCRVLPICSAMLKNNEQKRTGGRKQRNGMGKLDDAWPP